MPSLLTRRQALRLGGGAAVVGGLASQVRIDPVNTWEPAPGTWPCDRYDLGNTAANPHTSLPSNPEPDWMTAVSGGRRFVVGPEHVFVSDDETLTALGKRDGTTHWEVDVSPEPLVVHDGTLYHAHDGHLTALDAETGHRRWRAGGDATRSGIGNLLVSTDTAIVTTGGSASWVNPNLVAYDTRDGSRKWGYFGGRHGYVALAAHDGFLYANRSDGGIERYRRRSLLQAATGLSLTRAWKRRYSGHWIVVAAERVLWGDFWIYATEQRPGIVALDPESGERVWGTLRPERYDSSRRNNYGAEIPAVDGDRLFVAVDVHIDDGPDFQELVTVSLADGEVLWCQPLPYISDVVEADGAVLVGVGYPDERERHRGTIRAFDSATGRERWRAVTEYTPSWLAVADGTVFALSSGSEREGYVVALR